MSTSQAPGAEKLRQISFEHPILFYDGVCGMCNYFVDFIQKRDPAGQFHFAPLQGEAAEQMLERADIDQLQSVVLLKEGKIYRKSAAIVRVFWGLSVLWGCLGTVLWVIPKPLRDWGYRLFAKYRYRLFGQKESCRLPTPAERARFYD